MGPAAPAGLPVSALSPLFPLPLHFFLYSSMSLTQLFSSSSSLSLCSWRRRRQGRRRLSEATLLLAVAPPTTSPTSASSTALRALSRALPCQPLLLSPPLRTLFSISLSYPPLSRLHLPLFFPTFCGFQPLRPCLTLNVWHGAQVPRQGSVVPVLPEGVVPARAQAHPVQNREGQHEMLAPPSLPPSLLRPVPPSPL